MKELLDLRHCLAIRTTKIVGIAADHGGHELKQYLVMMLREAGAEVIDFGGHQLVPADDYPDFVVPLARAVAAGKVQRGVAICGSGVGACVVANKVNGVRACLIHDPFSAHQGVEDDDLNLICLGGLVVGPALAWELVRSFLIARFSGEERHRRRLGKVMAVEGESSRTTLNTCSPSEAAREAAASDRRIDVGMSPEVIDAPEGVGEALVQDIEMSGGKNFNPARSLRVYFIRHGQTEWSLSGQHSGRADIPLTAQGEDEARAVGRRLRNISFAHVLSSPLARAQQTCALAGLGPMPRIEPDLAEWDNGDDEGRTSDEILESRPDWNLFRDGSPNGETPAQISDRADRFIAHVRALSGNVALFSHSHFGRVLAARWIGLPVLEGRHLLLNTASVSVLCYEHESPDQPAIAIWNSSAHESFNPPSRSDGGEAGALKQRAIDRWEGEGGEVPDVPTPHPGEMGAIRSAGKTLFGFDLDGTLADSKPALDPGMAGLLKGAPRRRDFH